MSHFSQLDNILRNQTFNDDSVIEGAILPYMNVFADMENGVAVLSDLRKGLSRIVAGEFGVRLGIKQTDSVDSIWEREILMMMDEEERESKYLTELRFFNFVHRLPKSRRKNYYLATKLRMKCGDGKFVDVLHRMFYMYDSIGSVNFALCLYSPIVFDFHGKSVVVDSVSGQTEELTSAGDSRILSSRERQVLKLIEKGKTSNDIADLLAISKHTVSRHRQEIIAKLQVRNSVEACRVAKSLHILD